MLPDVRVCALQSGALKFYSVQHISKEIVKEKSSIELRRGRGGSTRNELLNLHFYPFSTLNFIIWCNLFWSQRREIPGSMPSVTVKNIPPCEIIPPVCFC